MKSNRVVITGMGVISPIGNTLAEFSASLKNGINGVAPITRFDASKFDTKFAAEVKNFDPLQFLDKKSIRRIDLFAQFALAASQMAYDDAGFTPASFTPERSGVVFGSGVGGIQTFHDQCVSYLTNGDPTKVSPFLITMLIPDIAAGLISIRFGFKGPNYCTVSACATGSHAIADAFMLIQRGSADVMICGGAEAPVTELSIAGFNSLRALSTWNERYSEASRPFDVDRNGFVMGEGSWAIVLESLEHALARGAKIYCELGGIGLSADAYHITAPEPEADGAIRAMNLCLQDAEMAPAEIDYINAHGTSTQYNDITETKALKAVFGEHAYKLAVSSTKSMTGHLLGAAGGIEAIASALAIHEGFVPPTINLNQPGEGCDLDYVPNKVRYQSVNAVISNSFGFGGHNASLLFKKYHS
ncbi:MAG: beta-ketoacyl-ACP synthase II [Ignavibacteria bacterium]|nr:beta-ketoacyl-ACP synthase II [Ignavibacteria bacterium]